MDPLLAGPLVALDPLAVGLAHAERAVLLGLVVLEALHAEDVVALHAVLLRLELGAAHAALQAVLAGVLLLGVALLRQPLQPPADRVVHVLAGQAPQEVVPHGHLALDTRGALPAVPQQVIVLGLVDVEGHAGCLCVGVGLSAELGALLMTEAQAVLAAVVGQRVNLVVATYAALLLDPHSPQVAQRVAESQHLVEVAGPEMVVRVEVINTLLDADVVADYVVELLLDLVVLRQSEVYHQFGLLDPL